ncbi:MAG: DnaJ domain-containing protein, partial [Acidimicrobiia bacterium]
MSENHYEVLGVEPTASRDQLRDAYRARVDALTAARDRKGITESQLQDNREEVAQVRSAWNVLSDPFQRQRYDSQVATDAGDGSDAVEIVDDSTAPAVQLTGWRRLMAPPPKTPAGSGVARSSNGDATAAPQRPGRQPTVVLPAGMKIAQPKVRAMALLFDLSVVVILLFAVQYLVPNLIQSDYGDKLSQVGSLDKASSAQGSITDAKKAINGANQAVSKAQDSGKQADLQSAQSDLQSAKTDLKNAQKDFANAQKDFNDKQASQGLAKQPLPTSTKQLDSMSSKLSDDIRTTQYLTALVTLVLALVYLVPITVMTGSTFGMRG